MCLSQRWVRVQEDLGHKGNLRDEQGYREGLGAFGKDGFLLVLGTTAGVSRHRAGTSRGCWWLVLALSVRVMCMGVQGCMERLGPHRRAHTSFPSLQPCRSAPAQGLRSQDLSLAPSPLLLLHSPSLFFFSFFFFSSLSLFFFKLRPVYLCRIKSLINPYLPSLAPYLPLGAVCPDTRYRMIDSLKICAAFFLILHLLSKYFCSHFSSSLIEAG